MDFIFDLVQRTTSIKCMWIYFGYLLEGYIKDARYQSLNRRWRCMIKKLSVDNVHNELLQDWATLLPGAPVCPPLRGDAEVWNDIKY